MNNSKFTDMKLKIYEENASGNISDEERDFLLEMVDIKHEEIILEAMRERKNTLLIDKEVGQMMHNEIFQKVFDMVKPFLINEWKKMVLYVGYTTGSYSMKFYTLDTNGKYTDCFNQDGANKAKLIQLFMNINKVLEPERKTLADKDLWSVMTMIVTSDGNLKVEFDYTDISENSIEYEQKWKKKYIR